MACCHRVGLGRLLWHLLSDTTTARQHTDASAEPLGCQIRGNTPMDLYENTSDLSYSGASGSRLVWFSAFLTSGASFYCWAGLVWIRQRSDRKSVELHLGNISPETSSSTRLWWEDSALKRTFNHLHSLKHLNYSYRCLGRETVPSVIQRKNPYFLFSTNYLRKTIWKLHHHHHHGCVTSATSQTRCFDLRCVQSLNDVTTRYCDKSTG